MSWLYVSAPRPGEAANAAGAPPEAVLVVLVVAPAGEPNSLSWCVLTLHAPPIRRYTPTDKSRVERHFAEITRIFEGTLPGISSASRVLRNDAGRPRRVDGDLT